MLLSAGGWSLSKAFLGSGQATADNLPARIAQIQSGLGIEPMEKPFLDECESLISPQDAEQALREHLAPWQKNWTSDDYVEMTHYAPTVRFYISRPALKPAPGKGAYPGWVMNALGGIPAAIDPTIEIGRASCRERVL